MESLPAGPASSMTEADLVGLRRSYAIESYFQLEAPKAYERASRPPAGRICLYEEFFRAGLRLPLQGFFIGLLSHIGLAPAALTPCSWLCICNFYAYCVLWEVEPSFRLFKYLFSVNWVLGDGPRGRCRIAWRGRRGVRQLVWGAQTSTAEWKTRYFFVSRLDGGEWYFPPWGALTPWAFLNPPPDRGIAEALDQLNGPLAPLLRDSLLEEMPPGAGLGLTGLVGAEAARACRRRDMEEASSRQVRARTTAPPSSAPGRSPGAPALASPPATAEGRAIAVAAEPRASGRSLNGAVSLSQVAFGAGTGGARGIVAERFSDTSWDSLLASDDEQDPLQASRSPPPSS